jgi:hypothetical protein
LFAVVVCQLSVEEKLQAARALLNDWTICFPALSASLSFSYLNATDAPEKYGQ